MHDIEELRAFHIKHYELEEKEWTDFYIALQDAQRHFKKRLEILTSVSLFSTVAASFVAYIFSDERSFPLSSISASSFAVYMARHKILEFLNGLEIESLEDMLGVSFQRKEEAVLCRIKTLYEANEISESICNSQLKCIPTEFIKQKNNQAKERIERFEGDKRK